MNKTLSIIFGLFLAIGLAFAGFSLWAIRDTQSFVAKAAMAQGQVVDLEYRYDSSRSSGSGGAYYPVVKYSTTTGEEHTFHSNAGSSPPSYRVGEAVGVLYDPKNPSMRASTGSSRSGCLPSSSARSDRCFRF